MLMKKFYNSKKMFQRLIVMLMILMMVLTPVSQQIPGSTNGITASAATANIADGAILHAWCWSFNTIKSNMASIAAAGYTSVQTSPAMNCLAGNSGNKSLSNWYFHYQPTDYKIGNYQLGTETEFSSMCQAADTYGIKIIVDVVQNHMTSDYNSIAATVRNTSNFFHTNTQITNWSDRYQITQLSLLGLWDNNTQNTAVQNYIKTYLQKCVSLGADGFRYDAAKHVELPDDGTFASSFWPNILSNGAVFQYGETLQDSVSRESAYANYMSVTASSYGKKLRDSLVSNNFSTSNLNNWLISVSANKMVTWVESHDNYANAITETGSSQFMTDEQIRLAWAVVGSRAGGTPLFFSRPVGGGGKSTDNRFPGSSQIGDRGSTLFMDDKVAAVNNFRNAMVGQNEYLRNPNGNNKILMIERGTKGVVIINLNTTSTSLSSVTNLANGSYTSKTSDKTPFTVANGTITGTLPKRSVIVLYGATTTPPSTSNSITVYYNTSWTSPRAHYQIGTGAWTTAPGVVMSSSTVTGYKMITINLGTATTLTACFNNGSGTWDSNGGSNYYFGAPGTYAVKNGVITSGVPQ